MIEPIIIGDCALYHGDNRDVLRQLPDNSIDSVVCDPPYHLTSIVKRFGGANAAPAQYGTDGAFARASRGFMQQNWDGGDIAFQSATWAEVLRVLKPGGYCAAFGAPRNFGRLQVAMFEAGFEERDTILNDLDTATPIAMFMDSLNDAQRDAFMKCFQQADIAGMLAWKFGVGFPKSHNVGRGIDLKKARDNGLELGPDDDVPTSPEGDNWRGFGTSLKPAFEPIVLARKPLSEKTVAANVLRWGTGALNIDGCRVPTDPSVDDPRLGGNGSWTTSKAQSGDTVSLPRGTVASSALGRWPANVVHDGSDEVVGAFPQSNGQQGRARNDGAEQGNSVLGKLRHVTTNPEPRGDSGSAARFFYSAKASKADRAGSKHPTVKPVKLIEWLATLITPPGGTILDPFAGSGTTGTAARNKGFNVILCEREDEYVEDIKRRLSAPHVAAAVAAQQPANDNLPRDLFGEVA